MVVVRPFSIPSDFSLHLFRFPLTNYIYAPHREIHTGKISPCEFECFILFLFIILLVGLFQFSLLVIHWCLQGPLNFILGVFCMLLRMPYVAEMQFKADMIAFSFRRMYILYILSCGPL